VPNGGILGKIDAEDRQKSLSDTSKYSTYEQEATLVGVVCIKDPVRGEVKPAIKSCKTAGIRVIMITGDSKETATAIAKELDILEAGQDIPASVYTGS